MSMELHVCFRGRLPTKAALQRAIREYGFPLTIKPASGSLEQQSGYMPMMLARMEETGIEFDVFDGRAAVEECTKGVDPRFDRCANFRWGSDSQEMLVAFCCAGALARLVDGVIFEPQEGRLLSVDEAIAFARKQLATVIVPREQWLPGTRPADIKRYLKPLLKTRGDLILRGRLLLIRPVRHVLRGAFFDRTSDKYSFQIWRHISPLYDQRHGVGYGDSLHMTVWQPYFELLLLDTLDQDLLAWPAGFASLSDFANGITRRTGGTMKHQVRALILAGERDRAFAWIEEYQRLSPRDATVWNIAEERALLDRDIQSVCEEHHRLEAESAKALKLGDAWEPTPFPAELPKAKREEANEVAFPKTPWVARPEWLLGKLPEQAGEVLFSRSAVWRKNRAVPLVPISRANAEALHLNHEEYCLFARLPDGEQLVLHRVSWWSPHNPEPLPLKEEARTAVDFHVCILKASNYLVVRFDEPMGQHGTIRLRRLDIRSYGDMVPTQWTSIFYDESKISYMRWEEGGPCHVQRPMADDEIATYRMNLPVFGEFEVLLECANACLSFTERASHSVRLA